jgi:hypothetical protein
MKIAIALKIVMLAALPTCAMAQTTRAQGDWPCRQIRVPKIAWETVWTGPPIDATARQSGRENPSIADLAPRIALRRTPLETADRLIADFAATAGAQKTERLTALFAAVYDQLDTERSEVVAGLDRYGRTQKEMAERLRSEAAALREEQDKKPIDAEKVKTASDALLWDTRVFDERRKAVSFVCEAPALIEQRLGALARSILQAME